MITFITLFLGLVTGERPIEMAVGESVAAVELKLDGEQIALLTGEPWSAAHDFGQQLVPHQLTAIARDRHGLEIERVEQWINLPRPPAEAGMVIEPVAGGKSRAGGEQRVRLTWQSITGEEPAEITASLDGTPLEVRDPRAIVLPAYDPTQIHFFRAELRFPSGLNSAVEATFGGTYSDTVQTELTAVPVQYEGRKAPTLEELAGALQVTGKPASVQAVEHGIGEVTFLVDVRAIDGLRALVSQTRGMTNRQWRAPLRKDQQMRMVRTYMIPEANGGKSYDLFPAGPSVTSKVGGVLVSLLRYGFHPDRPVVQRLADVVAAAGASAAGLRSRRHVVLLLGEAGEDPSVIAPATARSYLAALQVPLSVWSVAGSKPTSQSAWDEVVDVSTLPAFEGAVRTLVKQLDRQVIVWIAGRHLPQTIQVAPGASRFTISR